MFARNLLQAGDYAVLVPVGIPITLQYSDKGTLCKVYLHHDSDSRKEADSFILEHLLKEKQVPHKITIKGGQTYIQGVLYTSEFVSGQGDLPNSVLESYLDMYKNQPNTFSFYAGNAESSAYLFNTSLGVRQWLSASAFETLPGHLVPSGADDKTFDMMLRRDYPFRYPLISEYIVYRGKLVLYLSTGLSQWIVKDVKRQLDESGVITAAVTAEDGFIYKLPYSTVMKYSLVPGASVVMSEAKKVIYSYLSHPSKGFVDATITCSSCGKKLQIPSDPKVVFKCSDPQCNSVLYPRVKQMLETLELPTMSYEEYLDVSSRIGNLFSLPDIFDLEKYKDIEISTTLQKVVRAVIPKTVLPGAVQIAQLCDACNNSLDTLKYYVQHVDKMKLELGLDVHTFTRLFRWLLNPENSSDVIELLQAHNISYISSGCKFEGAPIFRDKTICITGTFLHGSNADIKAILESYAATVTTNYHGGVNCVLVGDIEENVKGNIIRAAKAAGVSIFKERDFFRQYDIDKDIAENLK